MIDDIGTPTAPPFRPVTRTAITNNGTFTPSARTLYRNDGWVWAEIAGGGGGGGGGGTSTDPSGSSGGSGFIYRGWLQILAATAVTIGSAGAGGSSNSDGSSGGDTVVSGVITVRGGQGGGKALGAFAAQGQVFGIPGAVGFPGPGIRGLMGPGQPTTGSPGHASAGRAADGWGAGGPGGAGRTTSSERNGGAATAGVAIFYEY